VNGSLLLLLLLLLLLQLKGIESIDAVRTH